MLPQEAHAKQLERQLNDIERGEFNAARAGFWANFAGNARSLIYFYYSTKALWNEADASKSKLLEMAVKEAAAKTEITRKISGGGVVYIHKTYEPNQQGTNPSSGLPIPKTWRLSGSPLPRGDDPYSVEPVFGMKESFESMKIFLAPFVANSKNPDDVVDVLAGFTLLNNKLSETAKLIIRPATNTNPDDIKAMDNIYKTINETVTESKKFQEIERNRSIGDSQSQPTVIPPGKGLFKIIDDVTQQFAKGEAEKEILNDTTTVKELDEVNNSTLISGDISLADVKKVMTIASLQKAPRGYDPRLWQAYCHYRISTVNLVKNLYSTAQKILQTRQAAKPPSVHTGMPQLIHGPDEVKYSINTALLRKRANKKNTSTNQGIGAVFPLLLEASKELKDYFSTGLSDDVTDNNVWKLSCTFGYYLKVNEPLETGDIARINNAMADKGYCWSVILKVSGWNVTEAICLIKGEFKHFTSSPGTVSFAWRAAPCLLFADNTQPGQFWGPRMNRMRGFVSQNLGFIGAAIGEEGFLRLIFENTRIAPRTCKEVLSMVAKEIIPISANAYPLPGCILFSTDHSTIAVMLSNGQFVIAYGNGQGKILPFTEFKPIGFWNPHL